MNGYQNELRKLLENPVFFLMNNGAPFFKSRSNQPWSNEEDALLTNIIHFVGNNQVFPLPFFCFPGRSGKAIYQRYLTLQNECLFNDIKEGEPPHPFYHFIRRYFLTKSETELAAEIKKLANDGIQITEFKIREMAQSYYIRPWIIAERAAFQYFIHNRLQIFDENGEYTEEFKQKHEAILSNFSNDLLNLAEQNNSNKAIAESIIKDFGLPSPKFSSTWIKAFFKRNRLSWRHGHFARRGKIDPTYVKIFLNQVAHAAVTYGWNKVYNIDETSIRINNGSTKTVAEIGTENVIINKDRNEKECFTAIGCCTFNQCQPLVIVSKGKTDKSKLKFYSKDAKEPKILLSKNTNGWTNEEVMLEYLDYFFQNVSHGQDCAMILDCLATHRTPAVLEKAFKLRIELIFVPSNGTGFYQPLDRRIFGILKSKLRSIAGTEALSGKKRFEIITSHLLEAWEMIKVNEKALTSAWNIPGLVKLVEKKRSRFGKNDDDDFRIDSIEEEKEQISTGENDTEEEEQINATNAEN